MTDVDPGAEPAQDNNDDEMLQEEIAQEQWTEPGVLGHRSVEDRFVAGVLGGIGERFNIEPFFLRLVVFGAAVLMRNDFPLLVPFLYAGAWIAVPEPGQPSLLATIRERASLQEATAAVLLAALASIFGAVSSLWVAALLALGGWALLERSSEPDRPSPPPPVVPPKYAGEATESGDVAESGGVGEPAVLASRATDPERQSAWGRTRRGVAGPLQALRSRPKRVPRPKRQPALWPLTLALLVSVAIAFAIVDRLASPGADPGVFVNLALIVIGGVLALSGWKGRAGWTVLLALPLIPLWVAFSVADIDRYEGTGRRTQVISSFDDGQPATVELGYGELEVTVATDAVPDGETVRLETFTTAGTTRIFVPDDVRIVLKSHVGMATTKVEHWGGARDASVDILLLGSYLEDIHLHYGATIDHGLVVNGTVARTYEPIIRICSVERLPYRNFLSQGFFSFWEGEIDATNGELSPQLLSEFDGLGLPVPEVVGTNSDGAIWKLSYSQWGEPCSPQATPANPGTLEIDTTLGIGEVTIVRYS